MEPNDEADWNEEEIREIWDQVNRRPREHNGVNLLVKQFATAVDIIARNSTMQTETNRATRERGDRHSAALSAMEVMPERVEAILGMIPKVETKLTGKLDLLSGRLQVVEQMTEAIRYGVWGLAILLLFDVIVRWLT